MATTSRPLTCPPKPAADGAYKGIDPAGATIVFWHNHSQDRETALKAIIDRFNKGNPWKITVNEIYKGGYNTIQDAMKAGIVTRDLPNLTVAYQNEAALYQSANPPTLIDLNNFVTDTTYGFGDKGLADFFQGFLTADINSQFNGARLGFPLYRSMEVLYYNQDALKALGYTAPPKTWDEFKDMACKYTKSGAGKIGYEVRTDASFVAAAAFAQGADVYDPKTNKFTLDSAAIQLAPQVMQDLMNSKCATLIAENNADQNDFAKQKSLFLIGSSSGIPFIQGAIDKAGKFNWTAAPIPYKDQPVQNIYGASVSIPKTTAQQELAAWLFVRWFSEPDQQAEWAKITNYFPVRQSTSAGLTDTFTKFPAYKAAFDLLKNTKGEPPIAAWAQARNDITKAFNNVLDGSSTADTFKKLNNDENDYLKAFKANLSTATPKPPAPATAAATMAATTSATVAATAAK